MYCFACGGNVGQIRIVVIAYIALDGDDTSVDRSKRDIFRESSVNFRQLSFKIRFGNGAG